jgi:hypothetical protein
VKIKRRHAPFAFLLFTVFFVASGCASLPTMPDGEIPPEVESPAETVSRPEEPPDFIDEVLLPETGIDEDLAVSGTDDDVPEIWIRAEELLAYLDSPLDLDLPEPEYVILEPSLAEAEPPVADEPLDPADSTGSAESAESTETIETIESIKPAAEVAEETGDGDSEPAEVVAEEEPPVPPAILRPVREVAAAPRREPVPVPPSPLPVLPARVPPNETKPQSEAVTPTRTVQATLGENAEVPLPGSGWVYLGEADNQSGLAYRQRRASAEGQVFVFRPESAGSYRLRFRKQDLLRGTETSEIVEVAVVEKNAPATPEEPAAIPAIAAPDTPSPETETAPPESPPLMADADDTASPAAFATAVPDDAALWNRGQALEAPGPNRDMKGALAAYETLVRDYPQSEYYTGSQRRIAYIERFFVNIR